MFELVEITCKHCGETMKVYLKSDVKTDVECEICGEIHYFNQIKLGVNL